MARSPDSAELSAGDLARARALVFAAWSEGIASAPALDALEWAEEHRQLTSVGSRARGGYSSDLTPYVRGVHEALSDICPAPKVVVMKAAQLGFTDVALNWLGWTIHLSPCGFFYVLPSKDGAEFFSRQRVEPMLDSCEVLRERIGERKSRDASNSTLVKTFPDGILRLIGANSGAGFRNFTARRGVFDDLDGFPQEVGEEGDPLKLGERAVRTFGDIAKLLYVSTPTIEGRSRIAKEFARSDRSFYFVACPSCGDSSPMAFREGSKFIPHARKWLVWDRDEPDSVRLLCSACGTLHDESIKRALLAGGQWIAQRPDRSHLSRGFHLSAMYAPPGWAPRWADLVREFLDAADDQAKLRAFVNTMLGETWLERFDPPPWEDLYRQREHYPVGTVPDGVHVLTCGIDVQGDRIELEVVGWGPGLESWSIEYVVLPGKVEEPDVWADLDLFLQKTWAGSNGRAFRLHGVAIDSSAYSQTVCAWARRQNLARVFAIKGGKATGLIGAAQPVDPQLKAGSSAKRRRAAKRGLAVWIVNVDDAKGELYSWLRLKPPLDLETESYKPGYAHFPEYGHEHFKGLTAEQLEAKTVAGVKRYRWRKHYQRNEQLDCRVYARAALALRRVDQWKPADWTRALREIGSSTSAPAPRPPTRPPTSGRPGFFERGGRGSGWFNAGR